MLLALYFKDSPHKVVFTYDGQQAVRRFLASQFDVILMDRQMPVLDGLAATRAIRIIESEQHRRPAAIVALTASALPSDIDDSRKAGSDTHLTKPVSKQNLLETIAALHRADSAEVPESLRLLAMSDLNRAAAPGGELSQPDSASTTDRVVFSQSR